MATVHGKLTTYTISMYFVTTVFSTVGFGDIGPANSSERICCMFLMLTGIVVFVSPGSTIQIWFSVLVSLTSLLAVTFFAPYASSQSDIISWIAMVCTLMMLLCTLALKVGSDEVEEGFQPYVENTMVVAQLLPVVAVAALVFTGVCDLGKKLRSADAVRRLPRGHALRDDDPTAGDADVVAAQRESPLST